MLGAALIEERELDGDRRILILEKIRRLGSASRAGTASPKNAPSVSRSVLNVSRETTSPGSILPRCATARLLRGASEVMRRQDAGSSTSSESGFFQDGKITTSPGQQCAVPHRRQPTPMFPGETMAGA